MDFEQWAREQSMCLVPARPDGAHKDYHSGTTQRAWDVWQKLSADMEGLEQDAEELACGNLSSAIELNEEIIAARDKTIADLRERYDELIMAVETKHPDEDRHHTALRCIRERQKSCRNLASAANAALKATQEAEG